MRHGFLGKAGDIPAGSQLLQSQGSYGEPMSSNRSSANTSMGKVVANYHTCFKGHLYETNHCLIFPINTYNFYTPVSRRAVLCDWVWRAGVRTGFRTITLVLYIGSLSNLAT
jgi:hypothetical protein